MSQTKIEVFISPTCPHCPHAKNIAVQVAKDNNVKVIETSTYTKKGSKRAQQYDIKSVPTLFITNPNYAERIGYVGVPSETQLIKMINIAEGKQEWPEKQSLLSRIKIKW